MTNFALRRQCESGILQELYDIHYSNLRADHNGSVTDSEANVDLKLSLTALEFQSVSGDKSESVKKMMKLKRTRLIKLVVSICIYSLLLTPCVYHIVCMYQRQETLGQERTYLQDISLLRNVLIDIQQELRATIINGSRQDSRVELDGSISKMNSNFQSSSFILGSLIKTRTRFVHALSEIRLEADTGQSLHVLVFKYNLLACFIQENIVEVTRQSHVTADKSYAGIDKLFAVLVILQKVDIYFRVDCASFQRTYDDVIIQCINTIRAHTMTLDFRGVTTVITQHELNFLMSIRQQLKLIPDKDFIGSSGRSPRNKVTCSEIDYELTNIIGNVTILSKGLFSSLDGKLYESRTEVIHTTGLYVAMFLICVGLFAMVCVIHHCIVNGLVTLDIVEDLLLKQVSEEQDRISSILLDVIPPEYIPMFLEGIGKAYTTEKDAMKDKRNSKYSLSRLKRSFDSIIKSVKNSSVQPEMSADFGSDEFIEMYNDVDNCAEYNVSLRSSVKSVPTFGRFYSTTLFMCDFIHLNDLVAVYKPDQFLNLVTCLIQILEERIKLYDVHVLCKNIDTFSVISSTSSQQTIRHVSEIANMALDIRASCSDLEVETLPDSKLRMRISIHTSDCVYKLSSHPEPRFHIYGELLDVAKQLRQTCSANRIHISEQVGIMLRKEQLYNVQRRGYIILPNGNYLATQWLLGRRVSVCYPNNDVMTKISVMPIQLAEKPIYKFDKEKVKYVSPYCISPQLTENSMALSESSYSESECSFNGSSESVK